MSLVNRLGALAFLIVAVLAFGAGQAWADAVSEAKQAGIVGEQADGYLGIVNREAATPAIERLVADINLRRREEYREIARKNGTTLAAVEAIAGKKLVERTPSGQFVRDDTGRWMRAP